MAEMSRSGDGSRASRAVVEAIAEEEGVDVTAVAPPEYEPLYSVVDPEALDRLFASGGSNAPREGRVAFAYAGYDVTVYSDGRVETAALDESNDRGDPSGYVER